MRGRFLGCYICKIITPLTACVQYTRASRALNDARTMHGTCMVRIIVLCTIAYWCLYKVSNTFSFTFSTIKSLAAKGKRLGDDDDVASLVKLLDQQVVQHGKEVRKLKDRNERQLKALDDTITRLEERLETLTELCRLKARNEHIAPCKFRMSHFHQFKTGYMSWFSPGFYTHPFGDRSHFEIKLRFLH